MAFYTVRHKGGMLFSNQTAQSSLFQLINEKWYLKIIEPLGMFQKSHNHVRRNLTEKIVTIFELEYIYN